MMKMCDRRIGINAGWKRMKSDLLEPPRTVAASHPNDRAYMQRPPHALGVKRGSLCEAQLRDRDTNPDDNVDFLIRCRCHGGRQLRLCPVESCLLCTLLWLLTTLKT
jgi:hypothetical protein